MSRRQIKNDIFSLLEKSPLEEIYKKLRAYPEVAVVNSLFMALCEPNEVIKWHAVSSFGEIVSTIEQENSERARVIMRRFLWSLNDESGGIGWGAPEAMAEIMVRNALLRREYLHMLISYMQEDGDELFQDGNFLELPLLQKGLLWGVGRLCHMFPDDMVAKGVDKELLKYLASGAREICGLALWALSGLGGKIPESNVVDKKNIPGKLRIYLNGVFQEVDLFPVDRDLMSAQEG